MYSNKRVAAEFSDLRGKILHKIEGSEGDEVMSFFCLDGSIYRMDHDQECCEHVFVEEIVGDLNDLLNAPILMAECVANQSPDNEYNGVESSTWTFYKLATINAYVTIRWLGTSNGCYSESVSFYCTQSPDLSVPLFWAH